MTEPTDAPGDNEGIGNPDPPFGPGPDDEGIGNTGRATRDRNDIDDLPPGVEMGNEESERLESIAPLAKLGLSG
ncbi:MAG TPA: hypothetical protein VID26_03485 [Candidatus Limnocylindrales bacterium]|jgi:hypothetical protein